MGFVESACRAGSGPSVRRAMAIGRENENRVMAGEVTRFGMYRDSILPFILALHLQLHFNLPEFGRIGQFFQHPIELPDATSHDLLHVFYHRVYRDGRDGCPVFPWPTVVLQ